MAGQLAIDFGNLYTVIAYWRQDCRQAQTLYIPGITRPVRLNADGNGKTIYMAPSLIRYQGPDGQYLVGQEAHETLNGVADDKNLYGNLNFDVVTGKRVYSQAGSNRLSGQRIAGDYLAAVICRAGQVLGLNNQAVIAATVPTEACLPGTVWQRYGRWLEDVVRRAGFTRLELVEQPWAAAWGAGMPVRPDDRYLVIDVETDRVEAVVVQAVPGDGGYHERRLRVLAHIREWACEQAAGPGCDTAGAGQLEHVVRQTLRQAAGLGCGSDTLTGVVVTGNGSQWPELKSVVHHLLGSVPLYDNCLREAAACGAAALTAGVEACGYIRHNYGVRYLDNGQYHYRLLVAGGTFYPSPDPGSALTIKASYQGQQEYALFIYRLAESGHYCVNQDSPLILKSSVASDCGQPAIYAMTSIDGAGQLRLTASEAGSGRLLADDVAVVKLT